MHLAKLMTALSFAATHHRDQRRKDRSRTPYINHLIEVAQLLVTYADVDDIEILNAAILHDVVEDTPVTPPLVAQHFGDRVAAIVAELTDDKSLPQAERKRLQVERIQAASDEARLIKLADHCSNIGTLPEDWPVARCDGYLMWSRQVVDVCFGLRPPLDREYDVRFRRAKAILDHVKTPH